VITNRRKLAIVTTHPIQYHAPWFRRLATNRSFELKVFYLWDFGTHARHDPGFGHSVQWDLPLLEGYECEFVPNTSRNPGTDNFHGIANPSLLARLNNYAPNATLVFGYNYRSLVRLIFAGRQGRPFPLIFRGDSHRLRAPTSAGRGQKPVTRRLKEAAKRRAITAIYKRFAAFLYVGKANHDYFRTHGVPESRMFFAPHAVDNERFFESAQIAAPQAQGWRRELGIPSHHLVILFAGKFEEKKRPLDLLEAFRQLKEPDVSLLFVGSGHLEEELRQHAAPVANVFFAPFQNQTVMPRTYAACDLFVLPSCGPAESWGLAVNEAMCMGKAVIVSDHAGCGPDLVKPLVNGLIFQAGDVAALSNALREAISDRERLQKWGAESQKIIRSYSYAEMTRGLLEALDSLGWDTLSADAVSRPKRKDAEQDVATRT
jgi:glycosyltransferase involved in cell wall biosynthesis